MSRTLYLVRHAIAEDNAPSGRDADRRLTARGATKMQRAARGLRALGVLPDAVLSSPYRRARETAELLCAALAPGLTPQVLSQLAPGGALSVPAALRLGTQVTSAMLVGHEPDLGLLAARLIGHGPSSAAIAFKKGGAAAIELDELPPKAPGTLCWLLTPKQLRAIAGDDEDDD